MAVRTNTSRQHADIKKDFEKLSNIREYGVQKFTTTYCLHRVAEEYYKSAKTVENIVFGRTARMTSSGQTDLFATPE